MYDKNPKLYKMANAGLLFQRKTKRNALECKTFDWYMTKVAPDFLKRYLALDSPLVSPGSLKVWHFLDSVWTPEL